MTDIPKEMQMCTPDWLESPREIWSGLRRKIYERARAKRRRMRAEYKALQTARTLREQRPDLWQK